MTKMKKEILIRTSISLGLVLFLIFLSLYSINKDEKIQSEMHERYNGGGGFVTVFTLIFVIINFPGVFLSFVIDSQHILNGKERIITNSIIMVLSSIFYFILTYYVIYFIQKRKKKKK